MKSFIVVSCLLLAFMVPGCTASDAKPVQAPPEKWQVNASVVKMSPEELFESSDVVVVGVVTGRPTTRRVPGPKTDNMPQGEPMVVTDWSVSVKEVVKGNPPTQIVVKLEGGSTSELEIDVVDEARLSQGEKVFLCLTQAGDGTYRVNGLFQGKYTITNDGRVSNKDPGLNDTLDNLKKRRRK